MSTEQVKKIFYAQDEATVLQELETTKEGLSDAEASKRITDFGPNSIELGKNRTLLQKFLDQFKDFMILVLLFAAIISATVGGEIADAIIILAVVIINAFLGVFQEQKAEEAIEALQKMASPLANVRRNGRMVQLKSEEIVPGDIIVLEAGNVVPADMRLYDISSLKVEEAALTGESVPVDKKLEIVPENAPLGDRKNMAFSSTNVTYGRAEGVVVGTAMNTEVGKIAHMLQNTEEKKTPLQQNQDQLGKFLTILILVIAVVMFFIGIYSGQRTWLEMLMVSISVAVAAIPEGLPAISTIILALGTQKMAKRNALVRKLPAVETLGGTEIICSDKTGTLTQNKMTIEKVYYNGQVHDSTEEIDLTLPLVKTMNFANDTKISSDNSLIGDPTETALVQFSLTKGFNIEDELEVTPRVGEVPFDSDRKLMSTIHPDQDRFTVYTKGAPDELLKRCTSIVKNGKVTPLTEADRNEILDSNHSMAIQALRVLAMAYKSIDTVPEETTSQTVEQDLIFAGLVGMIDPERPEAKMAIAEAKQAGIRTIMITGDHKDTASAIAKRLGILNSEHTDNSVITGSELDAIPQETFLKTVQEYAVYARVSPEHKVRIVKAWQSQNKVVAMTGDGVNDAPSLKQADIGIGMGITGTEVSKGASDMVLADDNFATIVHAVEEGRKVFSNIQKAVQYLLSANLGEVLTLFIATLLGWHILEPIHLLWINLVTDVFPAIALGLEEAEEDIMEQAPRGNSSNFFSNGVMASLVYQGIYEGAITLFVFWLATFHYGWDLHIGEAMAFLTLGFIQLSHAFNCKSVFKSLFSIRPFGNKQFNLAILVSLVLMLVVVFTPGLNTIFGIYDMTGQQWMIIILAALSVIPFVEIAKAILRGIGYDDKVNKLKM
ncbi:cation-translocating P-type ATPase [Jeotgalibaca sp. MA1X17-3]|uniref:cation-translocating P-type ATPase n=1 Tax=Jeotgalibaca sp. MA1X17-3 TaxID=2908211 RepID=UPI001F27B473|nr:cation-translocating P-type ATPase [Jeotgalibaca sp. MA1X17-3]UJF16507.1 cation-translocating P-type ATPase [Jeotgalibaca sp. MA1X17-3]